MIGQILELLSMFNFLSESAILQMLLLPLRYCKIIDYFLIFMFFPLSTIHFNETHVYNLQSFLRICNQINTTGATSGAGTAYPSGAPEFITGFQWGSCYSILSFMCNVLLIVVCPFVLFLLVIGFSVLRRYTNSDYPFGIFKLFLQLLYTLIKERFEAVHRRSTENTIIKRTIICLQGFFVWRNTLHLMSYQLWPPNHTKDSKNIMTNDNVYWLNYKQNDISNKTTTTKTMLII